MERVSVTSSTIRAVGYDPDSLTLEVVFTSGRVYRYHGVPREVHRQLMDAPSKGTCFNGFIRDVYPFTRM
jgi:hypothetical protein